MLNLEKIGKKITQERKKLHLTQTDLSNTLYVSHQAVSKWENGKSIPSIEILYEMTKLFNVSIDYLLENSEIDQSDYQSKFINMKREAVISSFLKSKNQDSELKNIFYLLNKQERNLIISLVIRKRIKIDIDRLWPYLNDNERRYLLGVILSNKLDFNISLIGHQLSTEERNLVNYHIKNGAYKYTLTYFNYKE